MFAVSTPSPLPKRLIYILGQDQHCVGDKEGINEDKSQFLVER